MTSENLYRSCTNCKNTVLKSANICPQCGAKQKKDLPIPKYIGAALLMWIVGAVIFNNQTNVGTSKPDVKSEVRNLLKLDFSWRTEGFGSVMKANFTIHNNGTHNIKDVQIKCEHYANSGTMIDQNTEVIYEVIKANSNRSFQDVNMGFIHNQARSTSCMIEDFRITD
ncbi:MAG: zinc ribbon domain-containing protein [Bdellovibrionales bacterium]